MGLVVVHWGNSTLNLSFSGSGIGPVLVSWGDVFFAIWGMNILKNVKLILIPSIARPIRWLTSALTLQTLRPSPFAQMRASWMIALVQAATLFWTWHSSSSTRWKVVPSSKITPLSWIKKIDQRSSDGPNRTQMDHQFKSKIYNKIHQFVFVFKKRSLYVPWLFGSILRIFSVPVSGSG